MVVIDGQQQRAGLIKPTPLQISLSTPSLTLGGPASLRSPASKAVKPPSSTPNTPITRRAASMLRSANDGLGIAFQERRRPQTASRTKTELLRAPPDFLRPAHVGAGGSPYGCGCLPASCGTALPSEVVPSPAQLHNLLSSGGPRERWLELSPKSPRGRHKAPIDFLDE
eukprot:977332-Prymnesium_polylepis.1